MAKERKKIQCKKCGIWVHWGRMGIHKKKHCMGEEGRRAMIAANRVLNRLFFGS